MTRTSVVVAGSLAHHRGRGGRAWLLLQYLLGFRRLGWDVLFLDRIDPWRSVDEAGKACAPEVSAPFRYLSKVMEGFGLEEDFAALCHGGSTFLGRSREEVLRRTRRAPFLLNFTGSLEDEEILGAAARRVFVDVEPGFEQMWRELGLANRLRGHDLFVTLGEKIGNPVCAVPDCGLTWIATPPPVVPALWDPPDAGRMGNGDQRVFSSVATWRGPHPRIEYQGRSYGLRDDEFRRLAPLPILSGVRFEVALEMGVLDREDRSLLAGNGWTVLKPWVVAGDPWTYRSFIHGSAAELRVAKNLHVQTQCGWVSDRSVCYLASGKPVLTQDTGIADRYPMGEGFLTFRSLDEAWAGVDQIRTRYEHHARAAREIALEYFDSDRVLGRLVERLTAC